MSKRILLSTAVLIATALSLAIATAFGAGGRLQLYLVKSGPATEFYNDSASADGDCNATSKPASLSATAGTGVQYDSPGYGFSAATDTPSDFSYTVPAGGGFSVPANSNAVILKLWSFSGDGICPGQTGNQLDEVLAPEALCSVELAGRVSSACKSTGPRRERHRALVSARRQNEKPGLCRAFR